QPYNIVFPQSKTQPLEIGLASEHMWLQRGWYLSPSVRITRQQALLHSLREGRHSAAHLYEPQLCAQEQKLPRPSLHPRTAISKNIPVETRLDTSRQPANATLKDAQLRRVPWNSMVLGVAQHNLAKPCTDRAEDRSSLFDWFTGTTAQSDFSCTFTSAVRF